MKKREREARMRARVRGRSNGEPSLGRRPPCPPSRVSEGQESERQGRARGSNLACLPMQGKEKEEAGFVRNRNKREGRFFNVEGSVVATERRGEEAAAERGREREKERERERETPVQTAPPNPQINLLQ